MLNVRSFGGGADSRFSSSKEVLRVRCSKQLSGAAATILISGAIVGCQGGSSTDITSGQPPPSSQPTDLVAGDPGSSTTSPASSLETVGPATLEVNVESRAIIRAAEDKVMAECMKLAGFEFVPVQLNDLISGYSADQVNQRTELPFDSSVEGNVYLPDQRAPQSFDNDAYARSLSPNEGEAYSIAAIGDFSDVETVGLPNGIDIEVPNDGCLSEARRSIFGDLTTALLHEAAFSELRSQAVSRTEADPTVQAVLESWRDCMSKTGLTFEHFSQARAEAAQDPASALLIAEADRICTENSELGIVYSEVLAIQQSAVVDENLGLVQEVRAETDAAVETSKAVLEQ